jgi:nitroreductase
VPLDPDVVLPLPEEPVERAHKVAAAAGSPVKNVYLAAHLLPLRRLTGRDDVVTGLVVSGRPELAGADRALGLFLNAVPFRLDLAGLAGADLIRAVSDAERDLLPHRRFPLARIRRAVGAVPFAVLFNYVSLHVADEVRRLTEVAVLDWWLSDRNNFPVSVEIGQSPGSGRWELAVRVDRRRFPYAVGVGWPTPSTKRWGSALCRIRKRGGEGMEFQEVIRRRRMVRRYDLDRPVPREVVDRILHNALRAPSAGFAQGCGLLVLDRPADIELFRTTVRPDEAPHRWMAATVAAPLLIVPHANKEVYLDRYARDDKGMTHRPEGWWPAPYWDIDAGFSSLLMLLTAVDAGLGACFFAIPVDRIEALQKAFDVPPESRPIGAISIGYPKDSATDLRGMRKPVAQQVHRGRWGAQ